MLIIIFQGNIQINTNKNLRTFCTMDNASLLLSQLPLVKAPHTPFGSPKLANLIGRISRPWQDNSKVLFSNAFPHAVPTTTVWKFAGNGFPPISKQNQRICTIFRKRARHMAPK
ncbi:hypothetical protein Fmac_013252 [Flemingia macrophylla]|uniref:Uncharacterized protein n=1 Tax=Flemingia macrophylla TaxID=520843 RepID=A0ABD1MT29_9FABA